MSSAARTPRLADLATHGRVGSGLDGIAWADLSLRPGGTVSVWPSSRVLWRTSRDVRGAGLFIGLELVSDRATKEPSTSLATAFVNGLRDRGILIGAAGSSGNVLKIRPPLCFRREHADQMIESCEDVLRALPQ